MTAKPRRLYDGRFHGVHRAGCRLPHLWLRDGRSLYDACGVRYTLLRNDPFVEVDSLLDAARLPGVPMTLLDLKGEALPAAMRHRLLICRADQLALAWRQGARRCAGAGRPAARCGAGRRGGHPIRRPPVGGRPAQPPSNASTISSTWARVSVSGGEIDEGVEQVAHQHALAAAVVADARADIIAQVERRLGGAVASHWTGDDQAQAAHIADDVLVASPAGSAAAAGNDADRTRVRVISPSSMDPSGWQ